MDNKTIGIGVGGLTLLGVLIAFLGNVFLGTGSFEDVRVGWAGLDRIHQTHLLDVTSLYQCDNYVLDSKDEEDPKFSVISVRPDKTAFLNATGSSVRGLFDYTTSGGDNLILMADKDAVYKSSGTLWTTLESGFSDSPWEGNLYTLPSINRLYLCNGLDNNKKFFSGRDRLYNMQNQDQETQISGTMYFTSNSITATGDAAALASLEAGQYVKSATTADDSQWVEVASKEGTTAIFSTRYTGTTASSTLCVRSNNVVNSRHMIEYEGHEVLGYTNISQEIQIAGISTAEPESYILRKAYGVSQSFTATKNNITGIKVRISKAFLFGDDATGNILVKLKDSISATVPSAQIIYSVKNLPDGIADFEFNFGYVRTTIGATYEITIERENSSTTPIQIQTGGAYAGGNSSYTYNPGGFNATWATGLTTIEVVPTKIGMDNFGGEPDTYIDENAPTTNYGITANTYAGFFGTKQRKSIFWYSLEYDYITQEAYNFSSVRLQLQKTGSGTGEIKVYRLLPMTDPATATWNVFASPLTWAIAGCGSPATDYTTADATTTTIGSATGAITLDVTAISNHWNIVTGINYGILVSCETTGQGMTFESSTAAANQPKWLLTTQTGTSDAAQDLYFEVISEKSNSSTVIYSKRFKPENFPTLNTFNVPGTIVGMAKSGGYLIIGTEKPDALCFFNATYNTDDGEGIKDTTRIDGITFGGGSHSIAYLPKEDSFIFYSGLGVYMQKGLQTVLLSGNIRDEAKGFTNYRDPLDYYGGMADLMPQAVIDPTKDTYMLAVPKALGVNSYLYNYNYANDSWVRWTNLYPTAMLLRQERGTTPTLYMGETSGQVWTLNKTGSVTQEATLAWFWSQKDINKFKRLDLVELWGRADEILTGCIVTLEVSGTNPISRDQLTTPVRQTLHITDNTTLDAQVQCKFDSVGVQARELRLSLFQSSLQGGISWRSIRYKGTISE